jgi:arginine/lysine/ornithine decarboxylase
MSDYLPSGLPYNYDITEIHGFDDLSNPQGILKETAGLAAHLFGSKDAFLLINGSTVGILAAIGAASKRGDKILAVKGCHRSTPNAAELFGLELVYLEPDYFPLKKQKPNNKLQHLENRKFANNYEHTNIPCSINPEAIKTTLQNNPQIKLVIITSPTYEGVVSDIASIAKIVHDADGILIVDAAHGAHFGFSEAFPENPVKLGADIVVTSLHKTLPALTSCSLLHICSERIDKSKVQHLLNILQTSSPSYILLASIDSCLRLLEAESEKLFMNYEEKLKTFYEEIKDLKNFHILSKNDGFYDFDKGKIVIIPNDIDLSGYDIANILRTKYQIEIESAYNKHTIAMTSICDTDVGFKRLAEALKSIDNAC